MRTLDYVLADVFTDRAFGGNPLAVFPAADRLDDATMQIIARELNLSESVFVFPAREPGHAARLRIFTPDMELPFAGHPTVGTACVLAEEDRLAGTDITFEEAVGPVRVSVARGEGGIRATLTAAVVPERGPAPPPAGDLAELLSIEVGDIVQEGIAPAMVSAGVPFTFVPVRDRATLGRVRLNAAAWADLLADAWAPHVYVFTLDAELAGSSVRARMFAPRMGIAEDPATGAAAAALPGLLAEDLPDGTFTWRIEQGFEMGRPSLIDVSADRRDGRLTAVRVGGRSVRVGAGRLFLP